jgi:NAD(P)-dependent dehydrogenase (short-subunit alcohol dehydrogenase family)
VSPGIGPTGHLKEESGMQQQAQTTAHDLTLSMDGKSVIVTGAASGIGRRTAELFVQSGAQVTGCDIRAVDPITAHGKMEVSVGDLSSEEHVRSTVDRAAGDGPLAALVHCAGIFDGPGLDADLALWERVIATNLTSGFLLLKYCIPRFLDSGGGSVVLIGSVSGINGGYASGPAYAASKAGVHGLVKWAAKHYAADGIRVNAVAPGTIRTPMSEDAQVATSLTPLGHAGDPLDIARAALYLASPAGGFVTGTVFVVDGGMTI